MELDDLRKLEHGSRGSRTALPDDAVVTAIIKVREAAYVPPGVEVRARIDEMLFTASFRADALKRLEDDPKVESIALPTRVDPVRK